MMLPQQLESALLGEDNGEEAGQLVGDWIDKVCGCTVVWYCACVWCVCVCACVEVLCCVV